MRVRYPDDTGHVVRDGIAITYEIYENNGPTIVLLPTWSLFTARHWKAQIPYLARHFRVVTYDGRGNGQSDRPVDPAAYHSSELLADALAVLDATNTKRAFLVGVSMGARLATTLSALHPDRVLGSVLIGITTRLGETDSECMRPTFTAELPNYQGWAKYNLHYWRSNYLDFTEFMVGKIFSEPHSTKQWEDGVGWANETSAEALIASELGESFGEDEERQAMAAIRCPVLVIHGTRDQIQHYSAAEKIAAATGGALLLIEGGGHCPQARDPVVVNRAIHDFVELNAPRKEILT